MHTRQLHVIYVWGPHCTYQAANFGIQQDSYATALCTTGAKPHQLVCRRRRCDRWRELLECRWARLRPGSARNPSWSEWYVWTSFHCYCSDCGTNCCSQYHRRGEWYQRSWRYHPFPCWKPCTKSVAYYRASPRKTSFHLYHPYCTNMSMYGKSSWVHSHSTPQQQ